MQTARRPYWSWSLDRWNLLVAILLAVLLVVLNARLAGEPAEVVVPPAPTPAPVAAAPAMQVSGEVPAVGEPLLLEGTGTPGATVKVYDGETVVAETTVGADGTWQVEVPPLAEGEHSLVAKTYSADGTEQTATEPLEVTVTESAVVVATPTPAPVAAAPAMQVSGEVPAVGEPLLLEGTGTPGATVKVYDGETVVAETTVGADGTWQVEVPPLAEGEHSLVAKTYSADGTEQTATEPLEVTVTESAVVVATPTPAPVAAAPAMQVSGEVPAVGEPLLLEGTGTPGATVKVYDGETVVAETTVGADGTWQVEVPPLAEGEHSLVAKTYSADGTEQTATEPLEVTVTESAVVVATPTPAPVAAAPAMQVSGEVPAVGEPLLLEGTGTPGATVKVYDGETVVAETTVGADGTWQVEVPPLAEGEHSLVAKTYSADGTEQTATEPLEVTVTESAVVVATPTPAPVAAAPAMQVSGEVPAVGEPLLLEGTGTPGATVKVYDGETVVAETTVGADGTWQVEVPPLAEGEHSLVAKTYSADGTEQTATEPLEVTVTESAVVVATPAPTPTGGAATAAATGAATSGLAATAEATPVPAGTATSVPAVTPEATATAISGAATVVPVGGLPEADAPLTLEGTGAPGSTVKVYDGDVQIGEATVGADGKWKLTLPALAMGAHTLMAKLFGTDGKEQATSQPLSVMIPALPGEAAVILPAIVLPADIEFKADAPVELAGTAAPGAKIKLYDGSKLVGEATVDASGNWKMSVSPLAAGEHVLTAVTYGTDGQVEGSSKPLTVTVSAAQPPAGQSSIAWPLDGSTVVSARPLLTGQAFPGGVVSVFDGEKLLGETLADSNGRWSFRPSVPLSPGQHVLTVAATTPDGQTTVESPPVTISVGARTVVIPSRKLPSGAAPAFVTPADGGIVNTVQPLFAGTAAPAAVVRLYDGAKVMGETTADSDGRWTFRPSAPLAEGEHTITAVVLNADGTESAAKSTLTLTVASGLGQKPAQPLLLARALPAILPNNRPALTGQASPGATVRIYDGDQLVGEVKAGPDGSWYFVPTAPLAPGEHVLRVDVVGPDGAKLASAEYPVTVVEGAKSIEPPKIVVPAQGQVAPGDVLSGTAPAGSRVRIYDGDTLIGTTTAGANGKWRFKLPKNLAAGQHVFRAAVLDQAEAPVSHSPSVPLKVVPPATLPVTGATLRGR